MIFERKCVEAAFTDGRKMKRVYIVGFVDPP